PTIIAVYLRAASCVFVGLFALQPSSHTTRITWDAVAPFHMRLEQRGITAATFASYVDRARQDNARRVRDGDLDHLIFYALQSTHFTRPPPIEPALSAKALVDHGGTIPSDVPPRIGEF